MPNDLLTVKTHFHRPHLIDTSNRVECNPDLMTENETDQVGQTSQDEKEKSHRRRSRSDSTSSGFGRARAVSLAGSIPCPVPMFSDHHSITMNRKQSNDSNGSNNNKSPLDQQDVEQLPTTVTSNWFTKNRSNKMLQLFIVLLMLIVCIFLCIRFIVDNIRPTVVRTPLGAIHGKTVQRLGKSVHEFLGVPFAQPPVETLRFRKPRPIRPWSRPLKAYHKASDCPRYSQESLEDDNETSTQSDEDCLYLNIWVPGDFLGQKDRAGKYRHFLDQQNLCSFFCLLITSKLSFLSISAESGRLAVLVWIHGGAFVMGSPNNHDGGALAAFGHVIVVSIAYRLGVFGFAYSGEAITASGESRLNSV